MWAAIEQKGGIAYCFCDDCKRIIEGRGSGFVFVKVNKPRNPRAIYQATDNVKFPDPNQMNLCCLEEAGS